MSNLSIGIGFDEDDNVILITDHDGEPRELELGKLSPDLVQVLYKTAEFLESTIEVKTAVIH